MKIVAIAVVLCVLCFNSVHGVHVQLSPITRVVELLKGLAEQAEKEGKKEEDLYETFVCWAKTVIDSKTATNAAAQERITELETYISDLDAGRIELTSERKDLEKQIKDLHQELERMENERNQEHEDFLQAKEEMDNAVDALNESIAVLKEATEGNTEGVLLQEKAHAQIEFSQRLKEASALQQAVVLGNKFLQRSDALFLRRLLMGEVPKADWKKLNRKANFKMAYKARSFKIQDILAKMFSTFVANRKEATDKEEKSLSDYNNLNQAKTGELEQAQTALTSMAAENGAKGMSKDDAQTEVDALKEQVSADEGFIEQTKTSLANKKGEWKARSELRTGEIAAINKAISILYSDDARDLMKKSFASNSFLQVTSTTSKMVAASQVLRSTAREAGDSRLLALVDPLADGSHFDQVISAIDKMIARLKGEETVDLQNKETCEKDRAGDTRIAIVAARAIDDATESIRQLVQEIAEIDDTVKNNNAEIVEIAKELNASTTERNDAHTAFLQSKSDDQAAHGLVISAKDVLAGFYKDNSLMFVQKRKMDPVAAGEAPPPPPTTWEAPYGGKTEEATGIVAILEMIAEDIQKDMAKAKSEEDADLAAYNTFKGACEKKTESLNTANIALEESKSSKESDISDAKSTRNTKKGEVQASIKKINDASEGCNYFTLNYEIRRVNRQAEIDGLIKAKAILEGGSFPSAFLQRK